MKSIKYMVGIVSLVGLYGLSFAFRISGTVQDKNSTPIGTAQVTIDGTSCSSLTTASEGHFTIDCQNANTSGRLYIKHLEYEDMYVGYNGSSPLTITLQIKSHGLNEVEVGACSDPTMVWDPATNSCVPQNPQDPDYGIDCTPDQMANGVCHASFEMISGIRWSSPKTSPTTFLQDVVLTATTFIGTVLTIALIVSGLMIIFGGANENLASRGKQGIKYALIGYVIVLSSYAIIRLVQYIA